MPHLIKANKINDLSADKNIQDYLHFGRTLNNPRASHLRKQIVVHPENEMRP